MKRPLILPSLPRSLLRSPPAAHPATHQRQSRPRPLRKQRRPPARCPCRPRHPAERTDFIVFIKEPEPLNVFTHDQLVCAPHSEVGDFLERPEAPRVQLYDGAGELLATQGLSDTGPVLDDLCSIHVKFLDIPVTDSYRVIFSGEDGDGNPYKFEGVTTFDKEKFDDGYTQSHTFELD